MNGYQRINSIPCQDLKTINWLWSKYSDGHFGFTIQKRIFVRIGGKIPGQSFEFFNSIGWYTKDKKLT